LSQHVGIFRFDAPAVENSRRPTAIKTIVDEISDLRVSVLNLLGGCVLSCADRPYRLVGNFDLFNIIFGDGLQRGVELARDYRRRLFGAPFVDGLANAKDWPHAVLDHRDNFLADHLVAFVKYVAPFRVANYDEFAADLGQHRGADLAGERAAILPMAVLRGKFHGAFLQNFLHRD
jgi:hypothetical protein